ncbi:conserved hypothetical protein [Histoplasma capsulatum H143]|uniref:Uncharacterized protein n=1 Tax=Ajellomyces capsulatus (strain H143) TaxID=544712 RepID=C6H9C6_AJECH|nr:conserved hypothetical protein [Histoplasma capsulatum H143]
MAEAHAQLFFFTQIKANPNSTIRIPEISHAWEKPGGLVYIVLEHIDIEHFASDEQRSQAITELISSNHAWEVLTFLPDANNCCKTVDFSSKPLVCSMPIYIEKTSLWIAAATTVLIRSYNSSDDLFRITT